MTKLYYIKRENFFELHKHHPKIKLSHVGQLFLMGFISDEDAKEIDKEFPNTLEEIGNIPYCNS